jgi:6-pyruvoyltetrahydropterin/6-carboxytetrahydropterin synthase
METITRAFKFDAAHFLPGYQGKCLNTHGHTWKLEITVKGDNKEKYPSMLMDFSSLKRVINEIIIENLDHKLINDTIEIPTAENIGRWIREKLNGTFGVNLIKIRLWESEDSYYTWEA